MSGQRSSTVQQTVDDCRTACSTAFADLITPGHPVTFLCNGCQVVVVRDGQTFNIALSGTFTRTSQRSVGMVLEAIGACAGAVNLTVGELDELDDAGTLMLQAAASAAARTTV